jgi:hypothetical protein
MAAIRSSHTANVANVTQSVGESDLRPSNAPSAVLQEMAAILAAVFGIAMAADLLLAFLHVEAS